MPRHAHQDEPTTVDFPAFRLRDAGEVDEFRAIYNKQRAGDPDGDIFEHIQTSVNLVEARRLNIKEALDMAADIDGAIATDGDDPELRDGIIHEFSLCDIDLSDFTLADLRDFYEELASQIDADVLVSGAEAIKRAVASIRADKSHSNSDSATIDPDQLREALEAMTESIEGLAESHGEEFACTHVRSFLAEWPDAAKYDFSAFCLADFDRFHELLCELTIDLPEEVDFDDIIGQAYLMVESERDLAAQDEAEVLELVAPSGGWGRITLDVGNDSLRVYNVPVDDDDDSGITVITPPDVPDITIFPRQNIED